MRYAVLAALVLAGCIEDPAPDGDPDELTDQGPADARVAWDGEPRTDRSVQDGGRDAQPADAARDAAPIIDRGPLNCDQPDPGSCEAAGCQWSDLTGCEEARTCDLSEADCAAAPGCDWGPRPDNGVIACRPVAGSTCSGWSPGDCRALEACLVLQGACIPAIDAPCDQVAVRDCWRSPNCVEEYAAECVDQPKQQEPPREADAGIGFAPDAAPQPEAEPEPAPECFGPGDCGQGDWCRGESCVSCDLPERCVDAP